MKRGKRAQFQMSFGWLFAIIVGAFVLFLAIYAAAKLIDTEQTEQDVKASAELEILLNPLETSFESGKTTSFAMPVSTRIYSRCDNSGTFGVQRIKISQISFNEWTDTDMDVPSYNKYIFAEVPAEGKSFYVFSKPFEFPFKVADLIYILPSENKYCFSNPPEEVEEELDDLELDNVFVNNCTGEEIRVCFSGSCDVRVNYGAGYIRKDGEVVYFHGDALMYAGIFSDTELYECQLKRLMQRVEQLALLYRDKANFVESRGCETDLKLTELISKADGFGESYDLLGEGSVSELAESIGDKNDNNGVCRLW